jgi:hypothetical protein
MNEDWRPLRKSTLDSRDSTVEIQVAQSVARGRKDIEGEFKTISSV